MTEMFILFNSQLYVKNRQQVMCKSKLKHIEHFQTNNIDKQSMAALNKHEVWENTKTRSNPGTDKYITPGLSIKYSK